MPNWCSYTMKAVSKSQEALDRLINIMNYNDDEYFIYRCAIADMTDEYQDDDYFVMYIEGDVAWSCGSWFDCIERTNETDGISPAHYITLDLLCQRLGIAVEVFVKNQVWSSKNIISVILMVMFYGMNVLNGIRHGLTMKVMNYLNRLSLVDLTIMVTLIPLRQSTMPFDGK